MWKEEAQHILKSCSSIFVDGLILRQYTTAPGRESKQHLQRKKQQS
jgi:hypothetical protein